MGLFLQRAAGPSATDRVRRLPGAREGPMRHSALIVFLAIVSYAPASAQAPASPHAAAGLDPQIEKLVESISEERLQQLLQKLVSFGTRNTLSDATSPTRGIGAARQWIFDELSRSSPRLQVSFDTYQIPKARRITRDVELRNVIAILPGKSPRRIYVSGHYDSVNLGARGQVALNAGAASGGARGAEAPAAG